MVNSNHVLLHTVDRYCDSDEYDEEQWWNGEEKMVSDEENDEIRERESVKKILEILENEWKC